MCACLCTWCSVIDHPLRGDLHPQAHPHDTLTLLDQPLNPALTRSLFHTKVGAGVQFSVIALTLIALVTTAFMYIYARHRRGFGRKTWETKSNRYAAIPETAPDMGKCTRLEVQPGFRPAQQGQFAHLSI